MEINIFIVLHPSSQQSTCALTVVWDCPNRDPCQRFVVSIVSLACLVLELSAYTRLTMRPMPILLPLVRLCGCLIHNHLRKSSHFVQTNAHNRVRIEINVSGL